MSNTSSTFKCSKPEPDTNKPPPLETSTPIERAGSDIWDWGGRGMWEEERWLSLEYKYVYPSTDKYRMNERRRGKRRDRII